MAMNQFWPTKIAGKIFRLLSDTLLIGFMVEEMEPPTHRTNHPYEPEPIFLQKTKQAT
ncbi:hypothetical protein NHJ13051_004836 [Beauveria bassiana]